MTETPINPQIEQIIRDSLAETKSWGWPEDDRMYSAAGSAQKYMEAHSDLDGPAANSIALALTKQIMAEEDEPTDRPGYEDGPDDEEQARIEEYLRKAGIPLIRLSILALRQSPRLSHKSQPCDIIQS